MALQDILEKIKGDALKESEKIKSENNEKITTFNASAEKEVKSVKDLTAELSKKKYEEEKRLKLSLATLELKNKLLSAKQELIDKAFNKTLSDIKALSADKYKELLIAAMLKVDVKGDEGIILGADDIGKLGKDFVNDINSAFSKSGKKVNFKMLNETREHVSGCVLKDGRKETICSFESIIAGKRKELEKEVALILFKE